jgi:hypothetical protein
LHIIPETHTHYLVYLHREAQSTVATITNLGGGIMKESFKLPDFDTNPPHRHLHGVENIHEMLELGFPLPYFMVFAGYTFILLIDKVIFDSHSLDHGAHNPVKDSIMRASYSTSRKLKNPTDQEKHSRKVYEDNK